MDVEFKLMESSVSECYFSWSENKLLFYILRFNHVASLFYQLI